MRARCVALALVALAATACGGGASNERTVLVDYEHDEFASAMFANFPSKVAVEQGTTLVFKQTWTGEPHTITGGTLVNDMMSKGGPWLTFFGNFEKLAATESGFPNPDKPTGTVGEFFERVEDAKDKAAAREVVSAYDQLVEEGVDIPDRTKDADEQFAELAEQVTSESDEFFENLGLPWAFEENEEGGYITQNAGQRCFLERGAPPEKPTDGCPDENQRQPRFDGTQTYYNSGIIPYEGAQGNTFRVPLASDIEPGSYWFYCAVHGPGQATEVDVVESGTDVPSQQDINKTARKEISVFAQPMTESFRDARDGRVRAGPEEIEGPFAGLSVPTHGTINEFVPKVFRAKAGEEVTWKIMGADHTVSFDVPPYLPIIEFADDGKVSLSKKVQDPAGGSPQPPVGGPPGEGPPGDGPPEITRVDGGTYDGTGFFSSGLFGGEPYAEYSLTFSKPGTYKYACLLHPPMVGTVEVT